MNAYSYLENYIIGQDGLKPELAILMETIKEGTNLNILIRGSSGYGKTYLAKVIYNYVGENLTCMYLGEHIYGFNSKCRIQVIDEAHEIKEPERLYPYMDSSDYTFIIMTNEFDDLKEPLTNRCIVFNLLPYSNREIATIIYKTFRNHRQILPNEFCLILATYSRGNPRVAKLLAKRLSLLFIRIGKPNTLEELEEILLLYFNLKSGGFTEFDKMYIDFLRNNRVAGIDTISRILCMPKKTIQVEIEPFLIKQGLIRITSRGRVFVGENNGN